MEISVIEPLVKAFHRTRWILFQSFDLGKWFVLGFCAWLAQLGEGGANFNFNFNGGGFQNNGHSKGPDLREFCQQALQWFQDNAVLIIILALVALTIVVLVGAVIIWLRSRGMFMLVDGISHNRAAITRPWHEFRIVGNSLFLFRFFFWILGTVVMLAILCLSLLALWPDLLEWEFTWHTAMVLIGAGIGVMLLVFLTLGIDWLLNDFVVPAMYVRGVRVMEAWRIVFRELLRPYLGSVALFALMRIAVGFGLGIVVLIFIVVVGCLTCCIACCLMGLPYLGTVILLPVTVFVRSYSLYFVQQFGEGWQTLAVEPDSPQLEIEEDASSAAPPGA